MEVVGSNRTGVRDFFSFSVLAHFLAKATAHKVLSGIFIRALQHTTFNPLYTSRLLFLAVTNVSDFSDFEKVANIISTH